MPVTGDRSEGFDIPGKPFSEGCRVFDLAGFTYLGNDNEDTALGSCRWHWTALKMGRKPAPIYFLKCSLCLLPPNSKSEGHTKSFNVLSILLRTDHIDFPAWLSGSDQIERLQTLANLSRPPV